MAAEHAAEAGGGGDAQYLTKWVNTSAVLGCATILYVVIWFSTGLVLSTASSVSGLTWSGPVAFSAACAAVRLSSNQGTCKARVTMA